MSAADANASADPAPSDSPIISGVLLRKLRDRVRQQLKATKLRVPMSIAVTLPKPGGGVVHVKTGSTLRSASEVIQLIWKVSEDDVRRAFRFWSNQSALRSDALLHECIQECNPDSANKLTLVLYNLLLQEDWQHVVDVARVCVDQSSRVQELVLILTPKKSSSKLENIPQDLNQLQWHVVCTITAEDLLPVTDQEARTLRARPALARVVRRIITDDPSGTANFNTYFDQLWSRRTRTEQDEQNLRATEEEESEAEDTQH
jgi:hypothetical protein